MPERDVQISISSNNPDLEENLLANKLHPEIRFVREKQKLPYRVFLIDIERDLTNISQNLIDIYKLCHDHDSKLVVVILHGENVDIEKNHYFQKMIDDLGKEKPLHRLVLTKDLYQTFSSTPSTPLDKYFYKAITDKKVNISEKGENIIYPLSLNDFVGAIIKTLFLSHTSGKNFWVLGDPITDLELSYLLKKNTSAVDQEELEINAVDKYNPKTNSLLSFGNRTRAELNWHPEDEIIDNMKLLVKIYCDTPRNEEKKPIEYKPLHRLINWIYRPRKKNPSRLPTVKKVVTKLLMTATLIIALMGLVVITTTGFSLHMLEKSINYALNGNIGKSVNTLNSAIKLKEIGESTFSSMVSISNLISLQGTEKIFNLYKLIDYSATSLGNLHQTYVMAENLLSSLNNEENTTNYSNLSLGLHSNLSQVYENLNQISFLSSGNKLPQYINEKLKKNSEFNNLKTLKEQIAEYIKVIDIIPAVFSGNEAKNILVLLQNSQIRQPNGGQVDYFLLLTIEKGRLVSKQYYTGTELEGILTKAITVVQKNKKSPTPTIPKLQDIVYDPDFSVTSNNISQYLEKAIKIKPDFIIATNDLLIKQLLREEKSPSIDQFEIIMGSSSGSAAYKDLVDQYLERLFNQDISLPVLGRTVAKTIGENQIYLWSANIDTERLLSTQSYSGVIAHHPCNAGITSNGECLAQTSYLSESTAQPVRQNPWQSRALSHTINISTDSIQHEYIVDYKHKETEPQGSIISTIYHLYLPAPSTLDKVLLNTLPASTKNVQKTSEGIFDHYKIPMVINSDQDATVQIKVITQTNSPFEVPFSYSITEYRQPGTNDPGNFLQITYPESLYPSIATSTFTTEPVKIKISLPPHTSTFGFTLDQNNR